MDTGCIILENLQESLTLALRKAGIRVREVQVTEEKGGRGKQVRLVVRGCNGRGICPGNHPAGGAQDAGTANGTGG